jgi:hypothetical protein
VDGDTEKPESTDQADNRARVVDQVGHECSPAFRVLESDQDSRVTRHPL